MLIGCSAAGLVAVLLIGWSGQVGPAVMLCLALAGAHLVAAGIYFTVTAGQRRRRPTNSRRE